MQENIIVQIGADISNFQSAINSVTSDLQSVGNNMSSFGKKMAVGFGAVTTAVTGALVYTVKKFADFDTEMRKAGAIAGASAKELEAMKKSAIELGGATSESASSVAKAMTEMSAKGFTANQTIAAMPGIIAAAEASGEDLALAADTVASSLNIFGLEAKESSKVADVLAMTANMSAAGISDMQYALKYAGAPAAALGISLEELSASIGLVVDSGTDGSGAGTALRASLLRLNNPAKAQAKLMNQLGFSMQDSEGKTKNLATIVRDLTKSMEGMTEAEKVAALAKIVGTEAVSGFLALMEAGPDVIEANTKALENSAGAAAAAGAEMKAGIGGSLEQMAGAFDSLVLAIGNKLAPTVQRAAEFFTDLMNKFNALSDRTQTLIAKSAMVTAAILAIGTGVGIVITGVGMLVSAFGAISGLLASVATSLGIAGGATGLLGAAFAAITGPIGIAVAAVAGVIAVSVLAYKKIWWFKEAVNDAWAAIKEGTVIAFNAIKDAISTAIKAVLDFVKPQLDKFKAFWDENGKAITILAKSYFTYLQTIIQGAMGIIKGIFEAVWSLIAATVKASWETIKLIVSTAINIVLGVVQTVLKVLQGDWKGAWETIKTTLINIWNDVGKFLDGISLEETGRDIINGLIKGIKSMGSAIIDAVKGVVGNVSKTVKEMLDIHSPSRVMEALGEFTGQGLAKGIASTNSLVANTAKELGKLLINVTKANGAEVTKIAAEAEKERTKVQTESAAKRKEIERNTGESIAVIYAGANKKTGNLTKSQSLRVQNIRKDTAAKLAKIESDSAAKLAKINDKAWEDMKKKESELSKERLAAVKAFVDDKKSLEQLSLVAESEMWRKAVTMFKSGTKERIQAQQEYQKSLKAVNDVIVSTNEEYAGKMTAINDRLRTQEQELTDAYTKSLDDRMTSLMSFAGLFDEFDIKVEKSGAELLANLNAQVNGFKTWQTEIEKIADRAIDDGLLAELREMGPKALPQLLALNSLTDEQLTQYSTLYAEKASLARQQAEAELIGMKEDTALRISELRATANIELETLRAEWIAKIQSVTKATDGELSSLKQIGINAGQGLLNGLASMQPALVTKATEIANAVKAAMAGAFDIHSPSRWMRDFIGVNMMKGWIDGIDSMRGAVLSTANNAAEWMTPSPTMAYSTPSSSAGTRMLRTNTVSTTSNGGGGFNPTITNYFTPAESTPSESARKQRDAMRRLALEYR